MKVTRLLIFVCLLYAGGVLHAQTVSLRERKIPIQKLLEKIEQQTGYTFFYNNRFFKDFKPVDISLSKVSLNDALLQIFSAGELDFSIVQQTVVISKKVRAASSLSTALTTITGRITDLQGMPIAGVTITARGAGNGKGGAAAKVWFSDRNGAFTASLLADNKALIFSNIGFQTREVAVENARSIEIVLSESVSPLDQVQITAYGTTTNRESTGNFSTISAVEINKNPSRNVFEVLQGQVSGLFVQQQSGLPGSPFNLMIRGQQSLSGGTRSSQPLIIIDGVALPRGKLPIYYNEVPETDAPLNDLLKGGNPLDYLDPSIIESVTILKDADATSIYGSRGAYGVILISTKRARPGPPKLTFNASSGLVVRGTTPRMLNTEQYLMIRKEAYLNEGLPVTAEQQAEDLKAEGPADRYTDWQKILYGNIAIVNRTNASYTGGSEQFNFLVSGNFRKQGTIQVGGGAIQDGGVNFNANSKTRDNKFSLSLNGSFLSSTDDAVPYDFSSSYLVTRAPNAPPLTNADGSINWDEYSNPLSAMNIIYNNTTNTLRSAFIVKYEPVAGFSFNAALAYNYMHSSQLRAQPSTFYNPASRYTTTSTLTHYSLRNLTIEPNISYVHKLGNKGTFTAKLGATLQDELTYYTNITGKDFLSDDLLYNPSLNQTGDVTSLYDRVPNKYVGVFTILNYNWDGRYIVNLNGRRDGSTKFGEDHRFGNFGSVGAAWVLSKETWFKNLLPILSFAKIRGSMGTSGGDGIENYGYLTTYLKGTSYQGSEALNAARLANKDLHWEQNRKSELGATFEFLDSRLTLDGTYYSSKTTDQLVLQLIPSTTGFTSLLSNSPAVIRNWGYEFEVRTRNIIKTNFSWTSRFNITLPKNRLLAYPDLEETGQGGTYKVGQSVQGIRLYKYAGVDPQTGLYNFINRNGVKGTYRVPIDEVGLDINLDRTEFVDLTPKFYGGFSNNLTYKGFSLDLFFTFTSRMGKNFLGSQPLPVGNANQNSSIAALDRWQKPGDVTDVQKPGQTIDAAFSQINFTNSTGAFERATYLRLSSMNLSYSFSEKLVKPIHLKGMNVFVQGSNLLTLSRYKDLDPENLGIGMAPLRIFMGGLNFIL